MPSRPSVLRERMSIDQARAILDKEARGWSDAQVVEACRQAEVLAQVIVEMFAATRTPERAM
jgi:hypothetical protein